MGFWTYILASQRNGTLYIGYTDDLSSRLIEHREGVFRGFTWNYGVHRLVWFEAFESREAVFERERRLKKWNRAWKIQLIERLNPSWADLTDQLTA